MEVTHSFQDPVSIVANGGSKGGNTKHGVGGAGGAASTGAGVISFSGGNGGNGQGEVLESLVVVEVPQIH